MRWIRAEDVAEILHAARHTAHLSVYSAIIVEAMRNSWTDERLDDGFDRVTADIQSLRSELHREVGSLRAELRDEVGSLRRETSSLRVVTGSLGQETSSLRRDMSLFRAETNARFEHLEGRFDDLQRTLMQFGSGIIVALMGVIATQL